jgi:4-hydroxy-3-methylbut-2-en-1-yl diphosphate synthase IspG/GcpE
MSEAGGGSVRIDMIPLGSDAEIVWQAMVDAALEEGRG